MTRLLDTERQYQTLSRRVGIIEAIEKCFDTSSRSQTEALKNAHQERKLKTAAQAGDVETVKQTWAEMKFKHQEGKI